MSTFICMTCGVQYPASETAPESCPICLDERQYVNPQGQQWTTLEALRENHHNEILLLEDGLMTVRTQPLFAISQHAHLIQTLQGNVLWDCISLIDTATVEAINTLDGLSAIAISHPHFYSAMVEWSHAFGRIPIYLHASDSQHVMNPDPVIHFWEGESLSVNSTITLIRCGGHFDGSTVLHWSSGAEGRGVLLTADTIYVASDTRYVTFMHSYPNMLPLPVAKVRQVAEAVQPYAFDRLYSAWPDKVIQSEAHEAVQKSAERYIRLLNEE
jgi:glyoxylase-like metal-dependent hydrolase (beta-lactamase superfamily II)